ncbi:DUF2487 family protein [Paenibacillus glycanilyticus]|uniref:DUF2487 family protein n=1 Tax=Paenibacillus glycanilyticus TaxID=126569 RepID=A0ABQ6GI10_9BACL|nr:DUF2487 family protein [Paenibacillus glycanilyticus]GLX68958.1 hypothetical protein MU1_33030 [Paenibacillus glycanilyticus]
MKFSDIAKEQWDELRPYLDTCLLPVTGMTGLEQPHEARIALEQLRDVMDLVEIPFKGRIVTYPAMHYGHGEAELINRTCQSLKGAGFRFVILISAVSLNELECPEADLIICPSADGEAPSAAIVSKAVQALWNGDGT